MLTGVSPLRSRIAAVSDGISSRAEDEMTNMPAKLQLTDMQRDEFVKAMIKDMSILDVAVILVDLAEHYAKDAPPRSPRANFVRVLRAGVGILDDGDF
jgi:hypothetical protein